ncbi:hypothetical protein EMIHUDRAFT_440463, partial [Emiliania huxleyi CCMP1516]|uniref:Uncharacterized protein n=2 Tax=Emiliania huxleyi TaxID=2903 RepID=A0A0D3KN33_EMIH1
GGRRRGRRGRRQLACSRHARTRGRVRLRRRHRLLPGRRVVRLALGRPSLLAPHRHPAPHLRASPRAAFGEGATALRARRPRRARLDRGARLGDRCRCARRAPRRGHTSLDAHGGLLHGNHDGDGGASGQQRQLWRRGGASLRGQSRRGGGASPARRGAGVRAGLARGERHVGRRGGAAWWGRGADWPRGGDKTIRWVG